MTKDHEAPTKGESAADAADSSIDEAPVQESPINQPVAEAFPSSPSPPDQVDRSSLHAEAERLRAFKNAKLKKNNQTPCPACATLVHIDENLCPHCNTDIAANNALVRESVRRLKDINSQLGSIRGQAWRSRLKRIIWPIWQRVQGFFLDPTRRDDLRVMIPSLAGFLAVVIVVRVTGNTLLFWSVSIVGGVAAYYLLGRSRTRRYVTMDFYRLALVFGLMLVMTTSVVGPTSFSGGTARAMVTVQSAKVNIRRSATTDSRIVTTVQEGDQLAVLKRGDAWYKVKTPDGKTGWVFANLVKE